MADRQMQYARAYTDESERSFADDKPGSPIMFTASTPGVKRDGMDLRASGWLTDNYRRSPVVLWCHNHTEPPIGTADAIVESTRLRMPVTFDQEDPFAVRVESKVRRRFIRACSVGWDFVDKDYQPLTWWRMTADEITNRAFYDLTELSIVPVGADPEALSERQRTGLRALSRELAALYDAQERPDSDALADQVRIALHDELARIGLDLNAVKALVRRPAEAEPGAEPQRATAPDDASTQSDAPDDIPNSEGDTEDSAARAAVVDQNAARLVLAAFGDL